MEKLKKNNKDSIIAVIKRLENGEITTPIDTDNQDKDTKDILSEIESLRRLIVKDKSDHAKELVEIQRNVANLTHDLKTPIAIIAGYAESMEDGLAKINFPTLIRTEAENMNQKVIKIIESARNVEECLREEKKLVNLKELLKFNENSLLKDSTCKIRIKRIPNVQVFVAEKSFRNIFVNLATNSIQHSNKKDLKITISFWRWYDKIIIIFKDNGKGIKKGDIPHVFERFYKGDKSRSGSGSGIGLSMIKATVEDHGGTISVKSKEEKYTKFIITMPYYIDDKPFVTNKSLIRSLCNVFLFPFMYWYDCINIIYQLFIKKRKQY